MILFGKIALGAVGTAVAGVGLLCSEGMVEVKVVERQPEVHHVYVIAPAMLAPIAVHFAPQRDLSHAAAEIRPWMPTIRAALDQLRETDDMTLVEVKEPGRARACGERRRIDRGGRGRQGRHGARFHADPRDFEHD